VPSASHFDPDPDCDFDPEEIMTAIRFNCSCLEQPLGEGSQAQYDGSKEFRDGNQALPCVHSDLVTARQMQ